MRDTRSFLPSNLGIVYATGGQMRESGNHGVRDDI